MSLLLARHFAMQTARRYGLPEKIFDADAVAALQTYAWPGNVRELKHLVERALLLCHGAAISGSDLGLWTPNKRFPKAPPQALNGMTLEAAEKMLIVSALQATQNNVSEAARRLGVSRMTLRYRMEKYELGIGE